MTGIERAISFAANTIAIFTFIAALLGWIGIDLLPKYTPPNTGVANLFLIIFALVSGYGISSLLKHMMIEGKPTMFLSIMLCIGFTFSIAYLFGIITLDMATEEKQLIRSNGLSLSILAYLACNFFLYIMPLIYPKGFTFGEWFKGSFRVRTWAAFGLTLILVMITATGTQMFVSIGPSSPTS